jgi:hypothetical protein
VPRVDPESLADRRLVRIFLAFRMSEARLAEQALEAAGIEYAVLVEPAGRSLFGSPRNAAVFCVADDRSAYCTELLTRTGLAVGIVPQQNEEDSLSQ